MEEIGKVKKDIGEFVEKLLSLVPPYDRISIFARECGLSVNFREMSKAYSEFFHPEVFSIIQRLLGIKIESDGSMSLNDLGYYLNNFIENIYKILNDDDFRRELSEFIGKDLPNPLEEYVKVCIDAIKQQDVKMIEILKILIDESYEFESLKSELNKKGITLEDSDLRSYLSTLKRLGLIEKSYRSYKVTNLMKRHLENYLRDL